MSLGFSRRPQPSHVAAPSPTVSPQERRRSLTTSKPFQDEKIATHEVVTAEVFTHVGDARILYTLTPFGHSWYRGPDVRARVTTQVLCFFSNFQLHTPIKFSNMSVAT